MTQEINSNIRIIHAVNGPITETITIRPIEEKDNKEIAALIRKVFEEFDAPKTESVYSDPLRPIVKDLQKSLHKVFLSLWWPK